MTDATSPTNYEPQDSEGWCYLRDPQLHGDQRALVSLQSDQGMEWVGIRVWNAARGRWFNGNEPERDRVLAWKPLTPTARRYWSRGQLLPTWPPADKS